MKIPPGILRSRSFTRFTIRVGLPHLGQSVLLVVSMTFLRSAVLAIFAGMVLLQLRHNSGIFVLNLELKGMGRAEDLGGLNH